MPFGLGIWEILILAGILLLLFGAKGAPGMARRLGTGIRELKDSVGEMDPRTMFDSEDEPAKAPAAPPRELEAAPPVVIADAEVVPSAEVLPPAEVVPPDEAEKPVEPEDRTPAS